MRYKNKTRNVDVALFYADQLPYPLNYDRTRFLFFW